jgi:hypothetical protein
MHTFLVCSNSLTSTITGSTLPMEGHGGMTMHSHTEDPEFDPWSNL